MPEGYPRRCPPPVGIAKAGGEACMRYEREYLLGMPLRAREEVRVGNWGRAGENGSGFERDGDRGSFFRGWDPMRL